MVAATQKETRRLRTTGLQDATATDVSTKNIVPKPATRVKRPPFRPSIRILDFTAGRFLVSSKSQAGHWHEVTVPTSGCTCPASARGLMCRHIALCEAYQTAILAARRQRVTTAPRTAPVAKGMMTCPGCGRTRWGILTEQNWCACQQQVAPAPISITRKRDGAAGLAEVFGS